MNKMELLKINNCISQEVDEDLLTIIIYRQKFWGNQTRRFRGPCLAKYIVQTNDLVIFIKKKNSKAHKLMFEVN